MTLSCIVVDDEPLAVSKLLDYIERIPFLQCKESFTDGLKAFEYLRSHTVDLLFLDIQMPELTGIQLLKVLQNKPAVILTTAYSEYALEGYELEVTDYLLKPISFDRFLKAVNKINPGTTTDESKGPTAEPASDFIFVKTEYKLQKVMLKSILYVEGMKDYLRIHTVEKPVMTLMSFHQLQELLPPDQFVRVHKSYLISIDKIDTIERKSVVIQKKLIPISDTYYEGFLNLLKERRMM